MNRGRYLLRCAATVLAFASWVDVLSAQLAQPPLAIDHNPDARVFETVLTATELSIEFVDGVKTPGMAFNGSVPGPTIDANLGDTLVVHFVNMLSEATVLHWHGVATPSTMDGSQLSQVPVASSGYHRYEFVLNTAGTFWYHPHLSTNEQVEKGLYGALIVRDPKHDAGLGVPRENELILFLDDIKLDEEHRIAPFATDLGASFEPWKRAEDLANSRIGNHVLLNGREVVPDAISSMAARAGEPYRLRLINVASGRIFRLDLGEKRSRMYAVGSDQGLWNTAELVAPIDQIPNERGHHNELISNPDVHLGVTLTPGDRLEIVLVPDADDESLEIRSHDFVKGKHTAYRDPEGNLLFGHDHFDGSEPVSALLAVLVESSDGAKAPWTPPELLRWDPTRALRPDRSLPTLPIFFGHSLPSVVDGSVMFFLRVDRAPELLARVHAGKEVQPIDFDPRPMMKQRAEDAVRVKVGEKRVWEIVNFTGNDHNFHVHGFRFQHLGTKYVDLDEPRKNREEPPLRRSWEDTIRIPMRSGLTLGRSYTIVRLATQFDDADLPYSLRRTPVQLVAGGLSPRPTSSGGWIVHCHFLEHAARGMMTFLDVSR